MLNTTVGAGIWNVCEGRVVSGRTGGPWLELGAGGGALLGLDVEGGALLELDVDGGTLLEVGVWEGVQLGIDWQLEPAPFPTQIRQPLVAVVRIDVDVGVGVFVGADVNSRGGRVPSSPWSVGSTVTAGHDPDEVIFVAVTLQPLMRDVLVVVQLDAPEAQETQ